MDTGLPGTSQTKYSGAPCVRAAIFANVSSYYDGRGSLHRRHADRRSGRYHAARGARAAELIERLSRGESIALVSDAGTPLVSDPGYRVVRAAIEAGIPVVPVPGPSALLAALAASGLGADAFRFGGFLPAKRNARRKMLEDLADQDCTLIFYEAPHRILETLADIDELLGARPVVIARELTKIHEEFLRGTAAEIRAALAARPAIKGEITLLIAKGEAAVDPAPAGDAVAQLERQGFSRMEAIKQVAKKRGISKRDLYRQLLK